MIALLLVIPLFGTRVLAADYDGTLTITGLDNNDSVRFFKIVEWNPSSDDAVGGWAPISPMTKAQLQTIIRTATQADVDSGKAQNVGDLIVEGISAELAGTLAKAFKDEQPIATETAASGKVELKVDDDDPATTDVDESFGPGIYMALITPADVDTVYNPVFVSSDFNKEQGGTWAVTENETYSDEAAAKKSITTLKKTATTCPEDAWDAPDTDNLEQVTPQGCQWTTTAIGDTVSFTVTTTIPGYGEVYTSPHFVLNDKLTDLTLDTDSVTIVEPTGLTEDEDYELEATAGGYKITFKPAYLRTVKTPTVVKVTYDAIVSTTAALHVNEEKNEVWTEYSHDPTDESDYKYKRDTTQHYTFTIDAEGVGLGGEGHGERTSEVVKVGRDAAGNPVTETTVTSEISSSSTWVSPLSQAEFKLYTDANCENEYVPKNTDGTAGSPLIIKSDADGRFTIKGLDAGTYYLKETKAPAGFIKDDHVAKIEILATFETKPVTEYTNGTTWVSVPTEGYDESYTFDTEILKTYDVWITPLPGGTREHTASYNFTNQGTDVKIDWVDHPPVELPHQFVNTQGTELPDTGGIGTTLFYVFGGILVLGAGILLVSRQRMMN